MSPGSLTRACAPALQERRLTVHCERCLELAEARRVRTAAKTILALGLQANIAKHLNPQPDPQFKFDHFISAISNSTFTSSFTFTVPPAMVTGVIPKSFCFNVADP